MSSRRDWIVLSGLIALTLIFLSIGAWNYGREKAWWGESGAMQMIRAEALANPSLVDLHLVSAHREQRGDALKSSGPVITNCFTGSKMNLQKAIEFAASDGWTEKPETRTAMTWTGSKAASLGGAMSAIVTLDGNNACALGELSVVVTY